MGLLKWQVVERTDRGQRLREQLGALPGEFAPLPHGQRELGRLVQEALARKAGRAPVNSTEQKTRVEHFPLPARSEEPTAVMTRRGSDDA